jgi:phage tail sheath gpL-like
MAYTSNPVITSTLLPAQVATGVSPIRMLICGQIGVGGGAVSGAVNQEVQNMTYAQINSLFGTNSELTGRINRAISISGGYVSIWVIGLSSAVSTVAAQYSMVISGTATAAYSIVLKLIDEQNYTITVTGNSGDTAATIAANINTAVAALTGFPASTSLNGGTIIFTARDTGSIPNKYAINVSGVPTGITMSTIGQFTGGFGDPTLTSIFTNVPSTRFHSISWPWQTNYSTLYGYLNPRLVINNAVLQGLGYIGYDDTEANIHTALNGATPVNYSTVVFMGNRQVNGISYLVTPWDWRVAEFMAIEALRLTVNAPIGTYVTTTAPLDLLGGPALASLPLFNTPLPYTDIEIPDNLFSATEQANAITDGFSVIGVNSSVTSAITGQVVTTYKYNSQGAADPSFKYVEYIRTCYVALEFIFNSLKSAYAQMRLTQSQPVGGRAEVSVQGIFNYFVSLFQTLSGPGYVLVPTGKVAIVYFKSNLNITANYSTGTINVTGMLPIVTQVRAINMPFQMSFSIGGGQ